MSGIRAEDLRCEEEYRQIEDMTGFYENVHLVRTQMSCTEEEACEMLIKHKNDVVNAMIEFYNEGVQ